MQGGQRNVGGDTECYWRFGAVYLSGLGYSADSWGNQQMVELTIHTGINLLNTVESMFL